MQFDYSLDEDHTGSLQVYDLSGKLLRNYQLEQGSNSLQLYLEELDNGIYLYQFIINGEMKSSDKLIIIK